MSGTGTIINAVSSAKLDWRDVYKNGDGAKKCCDDVGPCLERNGAASRRKYGNRLGAPHGYDKYVSVHVRKAGVDLDCRLDKIFHTIFHVLVLETHDRHRKTEIDFIPVQS